MEAEDNLFRGSEPLLLPGKVIDRWATGSENISLERSPEVVGLKAYWRPHRGADKVGGSCGP